MERINIMCATVEDYIYKKKGVIVKIDRSCFVDARQYEMLVYAYNIANGTK